MSKVFYRQCALERRVNETSTVHQVAWIPDKFAKVGNVIKIKNDDDTWTDGWVVKSAGEHKVEEPPDSHKGIKQHRKRTGDSMPKEKQAAHK